VYGDLDVSTLDEQPPGRQPVATYRVGPDDLDRWWEFVRKKLAGPPRNGARRPVSGACSPTLPPRRISATSGLTAASSAKKARLCTMISARASAETSRTSSPTTATR
jgi:hypothetical protein